MLLWCRRHFGRRRWLTRHPRCADQISRRLTPGTDEVLKHDAGSNDYGGECGRVKPPWPKERRFRSHSLARDLAEHRVSDSGIELRAEFRWRKRLSKQAAAL